MRWVKASERMPTRLDGDFDGDVIVRWKRGPSWLAEAVAWHSVGHHEEWLEDAFEKPAQKESCECRQHVAEVTMFGKTLLCRVQAFGEPHASYPPDRTLWVERAEDYYAMSHYSPPFCALTRDAWREAELEEVAKKVRDEARISKAFRSRFDCDKGD